MSITFCTACGARNRRGTTFCGRCGTSLGSVERVDTADWAPDQGGLGPVDELVPPSFWQQVKMRPLVSVAVAAGLVGILGLGAWLTSYLTQPPGCIEYLEFDCSVIVLERPVFSFVTPIEGQSQVRVGLSFQQAEVLDWLRLVVLARDEDGLVSVERLMDISAGGSNRIEACFSLVECLSIGAEMDIDYDGLTGQAGLTADGGVQMIRLQSSSSAKPVWNFTGRVPVGKVTEDLGNFSFEEIHLLSNDPVTQNSLTEVASQFRAELASAGIDIRLRVTTEVSSRSSSLSIARVTVGEDPASLRLDGSSVKVELHSGVTNRTWRGAFTATISHLINATLSGSLDSASNEFEVVTKRVVVIDCLQRELIDEIYVAKEIGELEIVCFESERFIQLATEKSPILIFVAASLRESDIVAKVFELFGRGSTPIFVVRL